MSAGVTPAGAWGSQAFQHHRFPNRPQIGFYDTCIAEASGRHTWMAFMDMDEFLIIRDGTPDMPTLLRDYEG
jgi:Glycosyltransferase family 92